jgi:hypothetical protein
VLEAERGFRKLAGYRGSPTLVAALRNHDTRTRPGVDASRLTDYVAATQFQQHSGHHPKRPQRK